jgi:hypothetical protein
MGSPPLENIVVALRKEGIAFEPGLTANEIREIENRYNLGFPPDLAAFLALGLPVSEGFPNWRTGMISQPREVISIAEQMKRPADGICFDIEHNNFWMDEWGPRSKDIQRAFQLAREKIKEALVLVPVFRHRFLPVEPLLE